MHSVSSSVTSRSVAPSPQFVHDETAIPKWHHRLLYSWCAKQSPPAGPLVSAAAVLSAHPDLWPEVALAERCGPHLAEVLRGTAAYQELLFPGGSMGTVRPVYQDAVVAGYYNECVVEAVRALVATLPASRQLRVLEVGALAAKCDVDK